MKVWVVLYHSPEEGEGTWLDNVYSKEGSAVARAGYLYFAEVLEREIEEG